MAKSRVGAARSASVIVAFCGAGRAGSADHVDTGQSIHRAAAIDVIAAVPRIIVDEDGLAFSRPLEAIVAGFLVTVFGVARAFLSSSACYGEPPRPGWRRPRPPLVLMYPLYLVIFGRSALTIVMMGFTAGLAPVILKTLEGLAGTRRVLINVGRSFNLTPSQQVLEDSVSGGAADDLRRTYGSG